MKERIIPKTVPDFEASRCFRFGGIKPVPGDPETATRFTATNTCLTTITNYLAYVADLWFAVCTTPPASLLTEAQRKLNRIPGNRFQGIVATAIVAVLFGDLDIDSLLGPAVPPPDFRAASPFVHLVLSQ